MQLISSGINQGRVMKTAYFLFYGPLNVKLGSTSQVSISAFICNWNSCIHSIMWYSVVLVAKLVVRNGFQNKDTCVTVS
jgi:hypothetical protein